MLQLITLADLQRLIDDKIQESLTLEYKALASLDKANKPRDELCKDVSAFANSAGGQIVYGIEEKNHKPVRVDGGSILSREWIEQVVDSNIQPRIEDLVITPIPLTTGSNAYVLTIPQAISRAPHQASDKKYYKRQNFQSVPMEDYEIRDILRRATTPELVSTLSFSAENANEHSLTLPDAQREGDYTQEPRCYFNLHFRISNQARAPAFYTVVTIGLDQNLGIAVLGDFSALGKRTTPGGQNPNFIRLLVGIPTQFPIFEGIQFPVNMGRPLRLSISPSRDGGFYICCQLQSPGFYTEHEWIMFKRGRLVRLELQPRSAIPLFPTI